MGDAKACADIGTASSTAATLHWTYWKVTGENMSPLAALPIMVEREQSAINVPSAVTCQAGGFSFPIVVTTDDDPFTDATVALALDVDTTDAANPIDNSYGITIDAGSKDGMTFA